MTSAQQGLVAPAGLALRSWALPAGQLPRATVLLVHGLGEHCGRYAALAQTLNGWGFAVVGYDQYGHGASDGPRGGLSHPNRLLDDLVRVADAVRAAGASASPLLLLGHSMGGLVASLFVARGLRPVDGLLLSSPALNAGLNPVQKLLVAVLPRLLPHLRVGNGLEVQALSHDPAQVQAYRQDALVHDRIAAGLARFIDEGGPEVLAQARQWRMPTLLLYAGADRLVDPQGSRMFEALAPADVVDSQGFGALYHELFNEAEPGRSQVLARLKQWLDRRFP